MSAELLNHILDRLTSIDSRMGGMATKDDIANMATKDDIANMATKDDIANMATKDDIANMATKDDIARLEMKLDSLLEQLVLNSKCLPTVKELPATVKDNTLDIKLLKKLLVR